MFIKDIISLNPNKISINSLNVNKGDVFVCLKGEFFDSHDFVNEAEKNGAIAIVSEKELPEIKIPVFIVTDTTKYLYDLTIAMYPNINDNIELFAVTGTNGKTSTSTICYKMLNHLTGGKTGYIGTNGVSYSGKDLGKNGYTTPPINMLFSIINDLKLKNIEKICMEVSAQAVMNERIKTLWFKTIIFTNIGKNEHAEDFGDFQNYFNYKLKLIEDNKSNVNLIYNIDDMVLSKKIDEIDCKKISIGIDSDANFRAKNIEYGLNTSFDLFHNDIFISRVNTMLLAKFNIYNLLSSISLLWIEGYSFEDIINSIKYVERIPGSFEVIDLGQNFTVIVDSVETTSGFEAFFSFIKNNMKYNNITHIFGAGGLRDKSKRPLLGEISEKYVNNIILTRQHPRTESATEIMNEISNGIKNKDIIKYIENRELAIETAIANAKPNDIIVITGKGIETTEEIDKNVFINFSDIEIAKKYIKMKIGK